MTISQSPQNKSLDAASWHTLLYTVIEHRPNRGLFWKSSLAFLTPRGLFTYSNAAPWLPNAPLALLFAVGFHCLKLTANIFPCVQKPDLAVKCLLFKSRMVSQIVSSGHLGLMAFSQAPQNKSLEAASWQL